MLKVVKIGGNIIDNPDALHSFLVDFAAMPGPKVLIHGGGKEASRLCRDMGIEPKLIDGRRVTDRPTLDVVAMVYAGLINKRIVAGLQALGCNAVGLSGADGNVIPATRRSPEPVDYGFVGDINPDCIDAAFILSLTGENKVPVFCAICHDGQGSLLNCNADSVAAAVALALSRIEEVELLFCFEKRGVLSNIDDDSSVIPVVTAADFDRMKRQGIVAKGMIPKLQNALNCAAGGVAKVRICDAESILPPTSGTEICVEHE